MPSRSGEISPELRNSGSIQEGNESFCSPGIVVEGAAVVIVQVGIENGNVDEQESCQHQEWNERGDPFPGDQAHSRKKDEIAQVVGMP